MDWRQFIFESDPTWFHRLQGLANHRFINQNLADEAFNFAFDKLAADGFRLLAGYSNKSTPGTYLTAVFVNLMEDFQRARFGRPRPSKELVRILGQLGRRVYRLLCIERREPETVVDRLCAGEKCDPAHVREVIAAVKRMVRNCGEGTQEIPLARDYDAPDQVTPETTLAEQEVTAVLTVIGGLLGNPAPITEEYWPHASGPVLPDAFKRCMAMLRKTLRISEQERLLLRLVYQEGKKITAVARYLGLPEHKVRREHKRVVQRMREVIQEAGLSADQIRRLFDG